MPVRNPISRLFSAWSGKYLIDEPYYAERLPAEFPRLQGPVSSLEHIAAAFEGFVIALRQVVDDRGFEAVDVHLWPQHALLARDAPGEALILKQERMREGLDAISEHLRSNGLDPGPAPHINETIVPYRDDLVSDLALHTITKLYAPDFDRWQYSEGRPVSSSRRVDLEWLNDVRGRNSRYGVLHRALMHESRERDRLSRELDFARRRAEELLGSRSWKVTGPLRWVSERTKG
jgi:hypothetical protein